MATSRVEMRGSPAEPGGLSSARVCQFFSFSACVLNVLSVLATAWKATCPRHLVIYGNDPALSYRVGRLPAQPACLLVHCEAG